MATHIVTPLVSADEFIRLYGEDEDSRLELIEGEVCEPALNGYTHDRVKNTIKTLFDEAGIRKLGFACWIEHSFRVGDRSVPTPDVAIISRERLINRTGNGPTEGAPEIALEVSISDRNSVTQRKVSAYLRNGAHAVCIAFPEARTIVVYTAHEWRELNPGDNLEFPALLPGVSIPVASVFEGV